MCSPNVARPSNSPRGEYHGYGFSHFEAYVGAGREQLIADELEFLHRYVLA